MGEKVGEIPYDEAAELVKGAAYPEDEHYPAEFLLISRKEKDDEGLPQPDGDLLDPIPFGTSAAGSKSDGDENKRVNN